MTGWALTQSKPSQKLFSHRQPAKYSQQQQGEQCKKCGSRFGNRCGAVTKRVEIARQLETKINSMFKRPREEVGAGEDAEFLTQTTDVSKSVTSKVLSGSRAAKTKSVKEGMIFRAYVLMEMPIGSANAALMDAIKKQEHMNTRFRASEGFQELEDEVDKYEEYKKEQGIAP
mgnify:CR=1 FL=1